jgi:hypothetical protein
LRIDIWKSNIRIWFERKAWTSTYPLPAFRVIWIRSHLCQMFVCLSPPETRFNELHSFSGHWKLVISSFSEILDSFWENSKNLFWYFIVILFSYESTLISDLQFREEFKPYLKLRDTDQEGETKDLHPRWRNCYQVSEMNFHIIPRTKFFDVSLLLSIPEVVGYFWWSRYFNDIIVSLIHSSDSFGGAQFKKINLQLALKTEYQCGIQGPTARKYNRLRCLYFIIRRRLLKLRFWRNFPTSQKKIIDGSNETTKHPALGHRQGLERHPTCEYFPQPSQ